MKSGKITGAVKNIVLFVLLIIFLVPFIILIINTFKTTQQFVENPISLPDHFDFDNYGKAINAMNFFSGFMNSLIITVAGVFVVVLFASMTAYLFARFKWKINKVLFFIMIASMTIPFQVVMIPLVTIYLFLLAFFICYLCNLWKSTHDGGVVASFMR